jgi:Mg2+/citrate symporter
MSFTTKIKTSLNTESKTKKEKIFWFFLLYVLAAIAMVVFSSLLHLVVAALSSH